MPIAAEYNDVDSRLLRKAADTGLDAFICDANEVIDLKLVRESKDVDDEETTFNPEMSHQVFGENETIFGYKDLKIKVQCFALSVRASDIWFSQCFISPPLLFAVVLQRGATHHFPWSFVFVQSEARWR